MAKQKSFVIAEISEKLT